MPLYFGFGSNMNWAQLLDRCPGARIVGRASLPDHRLAFGGWSRNWGGPVAPVAQAPGKSVPGILYCISDDDLRLLARYEGHPHTYRRCAAEVVDDEGQPWKAVLYWIAPEAGARPAIGYEAVLRSAYKAWGFGRLGPRKARQAAR